MSFLRKGLPVRAVLRPYNRCSTKPKFFQSHRFLHQRARFVRSAYHRPSVTSVLWSYFKVPSNLVFVSTNLLGLGILVTYRCLHSIANANRSVIEETVPEKAAPIEVSGLAGLCNSYSDRFELLASQYQGENDLTSDRVDDQLEFHEDVQEEDNGHTPMYLYDSPLSAEDLEDIGPAVMRSRKNERTKHLLINQLLSIFYIQYYIGHMLSMQHYNKELLNRLPMEAQKAVIETLFEAVAHQDFQMSDIKDFDDFLKLVPLKELTYSINTAHVHGLKDSVLKFNDHCLDEEALEKLEQNNELPELTNEDLDTFLQRYNRSGPLDPYCYLNFASLLINHKTCANINTVFGTFLHRLSEESNFTRNGLRDMIAKVFKVTHVLANEFLYEQMLKAAIDNKDFGLFNLCLRSLNIDRDSLLSEENKNKNATTRYLQDGSVSAVGTYFEPNLYITALKGYQKFHTDHHHLTRVIEKIIQSSMNLEGNYKIAFTNRKFKNFKSGVSYTIPQKLIKAIADIAKLYQDAPLLRWAYLKLDESMDLFQDRPELFEILDEAAQDLGIVLLSDKHKVESPIEEANL